MKSALTIADKIYLHSLTLEYELGFRDVERDRLKPEFGLTYDQAKRILNEN